MDSKQKWLDKPFEHFAEYGTDNLSIQKIAKEINVPRTTFVKFIGIKNVHRHYIGQNRKVVILN